MKVSFKERDLLLFSYKSSSHLYPKLEFTKCIITHYMPTCCTTTCCIMPCCITKLYSNSWHNEISNLYFTKLYLNYVVFLISLMIEQDTSNI